MSVFGDDEVVPDHFDFTYHEPSPTCVVAENCKVFYFEVPKVASSALKLLLADANGTYKPDERFDTLYANTSLEQTAHNPEVNGLTPLRKLDPLVREAGLKSPDWWRVAGLRDPYSRFYSGWENRILLMPPARRLERIARIDVTDVFENGCLNVTKTFVQFARDLAKHPDKFRLDGHFNTQKYTVRPEYVDYTHLFRVDVASEIDGFVKALSERVGRPLSLQRLNESIGLKGTQFLNAEVGKIIEDVFSDDFEAFGFERREFPESLPDVVLTPIETNLVMQYRALSERLSVVSRSGFARERRLLAMLKKEHAETQRRAGGRYAVGELLNVPKARLNWLLRRGR